MSSLWQRLRTERHLFKFLLSRILIKTRLSSLLLIKREDFRLRFYPTALSAALWVDPLERDIDVSFLRKYLKPGDYVIDVGANIGSITLMASSLVGNNGKVFSIEAHPQTFKYLLGNLGLNKIQNVITYNIALGHTQGVILFSNLQKTDDQNSVLTKDQGLPLQQCTLDDLSLSYSSIALLKIDVEGYEKFVLQGAKQTLDKTLCVYFESWEQHFAKYGYTCSDVLEFLSEQGFAIFKLSEPNILLPINPSYVSKYCENLVAVREIDRFLKRTDFQVKDFLTTLGPI